MSSLRPVVALALLFGTLPIMNGQTPSLLQIHRESPKSGNETAYAEIERDTAKLCARLGCPHPYLAAESLTGPHEIWFFNGYSSTAEQSEVAQRYRKNVPLMAALEINGKRKADLIKSSSSVVATHRPESSRGSPWAIGQGRFLVILIARSGQARDGTVFEAPDGTQFIVIPFQDLKAAEQKASEWGPDSRILAIRPAWSFPAIE